MLTAWILYAYVYTVLIFDIARFASYMLVKYYCYSDPSFYLFFIFIYLFIFLGGTKNCHMIKRKSIFSGTGIVYWLE